MLKTGLRVAGLFAVYGALGLGGDYLVGLLANDSARVEVVREVEVERQVVDVREIEELREVQVVRTGGACAFEMAREMTLAVSDGDLLSIEAGAGDLRVQGSEGLDEIVVSARICASHEEFLESMVLEVEREGGEIELSAHYPDRRGFRGGQNVARIDLSIAVPAGLDVDIEDSSGDIDVAAVGNLDIDDSSGDIRVAGVGTLDIDDSSGEIQIAGVTGSVDIDDSSSGIQIVGVSGDVEIDDGSGGIEVTGVEGSVRIEDGSGSIAVVGVSRDVRIEDGGGSIDVRDVAGDFVVERDGRGSIQHSNVGGTVDVPQRRRR